MDNLNEKFKALQEAESAMLTLNKHLGKEYFSKTTMALISDLKIDLIDAKEETLNEAII